MARPVRLDGVLDIECAHWDRFVCGVLYSPIHGTDRFTDPGEMVDELQRRGGTWWAWNGGRYDALLVADHLLRRGRLATLSLGGSAVTRLVAGHLTVLDATALIPMSLARAAELAGESAPRDLGWPCECGQWCGGYCAITPNLRGPRLAALLDYCAHDAVVTYRVIAAVLTRWHREGFALRSTIGGTAWATARAWEGLPKATWEDPNGRIQYAIWRATRRAYYGGRVIVARPKATVGAHYDLSSAYPAALANVALPVGDPVQGARRRAALAYKREVPGVYQARVRVADTYLPPLPVRDRRGRITYPTGEFQGTWTLPELQSAERHGAQIQAFGEAICWPDPPRPLFRGVIDRWYASRIEAGKSSAWGELYNALARSLTGKLGQDADRSGVVINPSTVLYCDPRVKRCRLAGCVKGKCSKRCRSYSQLDQDGRIYSVPFYAIPESSHVHWAAYLTATTRATILDAAAHVGSDLVYTHTDSIWTLATPPPDVGEGIGQFALKHTWGDFDCRAVGTFRYVDGNTGEVVCRTGGQQAMSDAEWSALDHRGVEMEAHRGVLSLREAAPGGSLFKRAYRLRALPESEGRFGDRQLAPGTGRTYPLPYGKENDRGNRGREGE